MKDLQAAFEKCLRMCDKCGIPYGRIESVEPNTRAKSRWGQCRCIAPGTLFKPAEFCINVNEQLLRDDAPDRSLEETLLHEICHTVPGGNDHGGAWKAAVERLNRRYGYSISRTRSPEQLGVPDERTPRAPRYIIQCERCGQAIARTRKSKLVTHTAHYRCARCGGRLSCGGLPTAATD